MLGTLLKKQFLELFRNFFYNARKNKARTKKQIIAQIVLYFLLFYGFLGAGVFGGMAYGLSSALVSAGHSWMYFLVMSSVAIVMGVFGSVFSTYSSLYLSTDNDLLLSMPIPVKDILISRLAGVFLVGMLYSSIVMIPTLVVYFITAQLSFIGILCPLITAVDVTVFIFILSVALGWVVARLSMKVRNKSLITTVTALAFIAACVIASQSVIHCQRHVVCRILSSSLIILHAGIGCGYISCPVDSYIERLRIQHHRC